MKEFDKEVSTDDNYIIRYLIIPKTDQATFLDFINYKTPNDKYTTVNTWNIPDGTTIIKRRNILID